MAWGTLTIGSLVLKETDVLEDVTNANTGERTVRLEGAETAPSSATIGEVQLKQADIMGLIDRILPVQFERKTEYNGYYRVTDTNTTYEKWVQGPGQVRWSLAMERVGPDNSVDIESRLANVVRLNDFSTVGERWHAPAAGHYGYYVGAVAPATVVRQSDTGPITVYRSIPAGVNPRWGATVAGYQQGRVRFLTNSIERVSPRIPCAVTGWEMNNGLVRVKPATTAGTTLFIAVWDGTAWREEPWDLRIAGSSLLPGTHFVALTVTRLDPEMVTLRIVAKQPATDARVLVDLSLRRGSRFVEGYVQRTTSGDITACPDVAQVWVDQGQYTRASGPDANGVIWAAGSSRTWSMAANGGLTKSATTAMDFWVGAEVPGITPGGGGDPGFETGTTAPWVPTGNTFTVVSGGAQHGTYFGRLTATGGTEARIEQGFDVAATAGKVYTVSGWVRSPVALAAGVVRLRAKWVNVSTPISTIDVNAPALSANVWTPVTANLTAPATTTKVARQAALTGTPTAGAVLDVDSLHIREATDTGDTLAILQDQYIAAMAEKVGVVRR